LPLAFSVAETQPNSIVTLRQPQGITLAHRPTFGWKTTISMEVFMQVSQASNQSVWKQVYQDALFEFDQTRLRPKLEAALKTMEDRLSELRSDPADRRELVELEYAKHTIEFLRNHELQT
jgi:outer membrane protein OmpA-like peptidoglycan-associated protein